MEKVKVMDDPHHNVYLVWDYALTQILCCARDFVYTQTLCEIAGGRDICLIEL